MLLPVQGLSFPFSQNTEQEQEEVLLHFRYRGFGNEYVSAVYSKHTNTFYLPIHELFTLLGFEVQLDGKANRIEGTFTNRETFRIYYIEKRALLNEKETRFSDSEIRVLTTGIFISPDLLSEIFDMQFSVDFSNLALHLETTQVLPIVEARERQRRRERVLASERNINRTFYPLRFERRRHTLNAGFLDYSLTSNRSSQHNSLLYTASFGTEVFGGGLEGSFLGSHSSQATVLQPSNVRWTYGVRDSKVLSSVAVGQSVSQGVSPIAFNGFSISNEPLQPRYHFEDIFVTGSVQPDAEVELYRNNRLIDFQRSNGSGMYQFQLPLTYGTSNYSIKTYGPSGERILRDAIIRIPFNFLPPGEINYNLDVGKLANPVSGSLNRGLMGRSNVSAGLSKRVTATGGIEYFEDFQEDFPTVTGGIYARFFQSYLMSAEFASNAFYRGAISVYESSSASANAEYTYFTMEGGIYNPSRYRSTLRTNLFTPLPAGRLPLNLRLSATHNNRQSGSITRYQFDLNSRIGRVNVRAGYRDTQIGKLSFRSNQTARLHGSASYTTSNARNIPPILRGVFLRAQLNYLPSLNQLESADVRLSKDILNSSGRIHISAGRNFTGRFSQARVSLSFDFSAFRSTSTARTTGTRFTASQSIRGSLGHDSYNNNTFFRNRRQVGRSGLAVRFYLDHNNNGAFDSADEIVQTSRNVLRIHRANGRIEKKAGVYYLTQLQPNRRYNISIKNSGFKNPSHIPAFNKFSAVTDPNQFKAIDIPVFVTGVIEGKVTKNQYGGETGLTGVRLYIKQKATADGKESREFQLRTFSDGSFYGYEIPPGDYEISFDKSQLEFMNVVPPAEKTQFTLESTPGGDVEENLDISLNPKPTDSTRACVQIDGDGMDDQQFYYISTESYKTFSEAEQAAEKFQARNGMTFKTVFNSFNKAFYLRSSNIFTEKELHALGQKDRPGSHQVPFFVISEESLFNSLSNTIQTNRQRLHLGTFETAERAVELADALHSETQLNAYISWNGSRDTFSVYLNLDANSIDTKQAVELLLPFLAVIDPSGLSANINYRLAHKQSADPQLLKLLADHLKSYFEKSFTTDFRACDSTLIVTSDNVSFQELIQVTERVEEKTKIENLMIEIQPGSIDSTIRNSE